MSRSYESQVGAFAGGTFGASELGQGVGDESVVSGRKLPLENLPDGLTVHDIGIVTPRGRIPRRLHGWPKPYDFSEAPRVCVTPGGDLLMICVTGIGHQ